MSWPVVQQLSAHLPPPPVLVVWPAIECRWAGTIINGWHLGIIHAASFETKGSNNFSRIERSYETCAHVKIPFKESVSREFFAPIVYGLQFVFSFVEIILWQVQPLLLRGVKDTEESAFYRLCLFQFKTLYTIQILFIKGFYLNVFHSDSAKWISTPRFLLTQRSSIVNLYNSDSAKWMSTPRFLLTAEFHCKFV